MSKGQIKDKLVEMAKRDVKNRVIHDNPYRCTSAEWIKLEQDYVSYASPDRKGIINRTLSGYGQKLSR